MIEKYIDIPTADGRMETFISYPEQGGPFAPVVIYMDVWGLREELYDIARKVAVVGYYVVLPDLYYRQGRIRHQWRNERGQMISMHNLDPERQAQVRAPRGPTVSRSMLPAISPAVISHLAMPNSGVRRYAAALQSLVSAGARDRLARAEEPVVRRLSPGGKWIRTIGPPPEIVVDPSG